MGNSSSRRNKDEDKHKEADTHYEGYNGECGTQEEVWRAGAAEARLEDHDSPGPIGDAINTIIDANSNINWAVAPSQITGTHNAEDCPNKDTN